MKKALLSGLLAVAAVGCLAGGIAAAPSVNAVSPEPKQEDLAITSIQIGDVRVQLLSETLVRIEDRGVKSGEFENRPSYIVSNRNDWEPVEYVTRTVNGQIEIVTSSYVVHVPSGGTAEDVYITYDGAELYHYVGQTDTNVYIPSPSDELKSWYFTDSPRVIPSEHGYSVTDDDTPLQGWDFTDKGTTDIFVFLPKGSYTQFSNDYTSLTGKSEMVNLQTLGYWDSRWYAYTADSALQQIQDYIDKGYSIDVIVIDVDWKDSDSLHGGGIGYDINTDLFPDMADFLEKCHELGVAVNFNDHPEPVPGTSNGLDAEEVEFRSTNLKLILGMGLDYWWYDRNWHTALNSFDPDVSVFAFGMYAFQFITQEYFEELAATNGLEDFARRALIMGNVDGCLHGKWTYASDISAHRYTIQWTGDIGADSAALAQEIYAAVFGATEVGIPYMSSDLGGHTQAVTDSMYVRWLQYGALSAITRVHCTNAEYIGQEGRMPWLFTDTVPNTEEIVKEYVGMRYRMLPLYYALAFQNYDEGLPILRRLDVNYSQYVEAQRNDEYLLGDYILVAPIAEASSLNITDASHFPGGLYAEYYNYDNNNESYNGNNWDLAFGGSPVFTRTDTNINFDWGSGGPGNGVGNDKFAVRWTGTFKVGSRPARLTFFADDFVKVWIDGQLVVTNVKEASGTPAYDTFISTEEYYAAGSSHEIKVEYIEDGGNAHVYCYYVELNDGTTSASYNTREVFIPEGSWIDVWTGDRFVGPKTYKVTHPLETSPIFVREGALVVLMEQEQNTSMMTWANLSLDVYPSKNYTAHTTVYEDDTTTVAYKSGLYRTTDVDMHFDDAHSTLLVTIDASNGSFNGARGEVTTRTWNVRLHTNPGWGEITAVRVNGTPYTLTEYLKTTSASPFAFEGPARDGNLSTFTFEGQVYEKYVIEVVYASAVNSERARDYDATALDFTLETGEAGGSIDLTEAGDIDWVTYGHGSSLEAVRKAGGGNLFGDPTSYDTNWLTNEIFFSQSYSDGDISDRGSNEGGYASQKNFDLEIKTAGKDCYYVLYVGGTLCTAKVTVRDRAGNVRTEYFGDFKGSFTQRIVIHCTSEEESTLYVTYAMVASENNGTGSPSQVYLLGGYAATKLPATTDVADVAMEGELWANTPAQGRLDLTDAFENVGADTLDWQQFGDYGDSGDVMMKQNGGAYITSVSFRERNYFGDYKAILGWSDGAGSIGAHTGSTLGICSPGSITARIHVTPDVRYIRLYTGAWNGTNTTLLYSAGGKLLAQAPAFTAGSNSVCRAITFEVHAEEETDVTVMIVSTNATSNGNVSLAGIAVGGVPTKSVKITSSQTAVSGDIDLSAQGIIDWAYLGGSGAEKAGGNAISAIQKSGYTAAHESFGASLSYTDSGSASGLKGGLYADWMRFTVTVDENTSYVEFYVHSEGTAHAGVNVITADGVILYHTLPGKTGSTCIRLEVKATASTELTVMFFKGGDGGGQAGLTAIAIG